MLDPMTGRNTGRRIAHTDGYEARLPWPPDAKIQGGARGIVLSRAPGKTYRTAFVEAFLAGTFIRGEGETLEKAEDDCWEKYQRVLHCPGPTGEHEYAPHPPNNPENLYRNGAGFCRHCGSFQPDVFTGVDLGQRCEVCNNPTLWWFGENTDGEAVFLCEEHVDRKGEYLQGPLTLLEELLEVAMEDRQEAAGR